MSNDFDSSSKVSSAFLSHAKNLSDPSRQCNPATDDHNHHHQQRQAREGAMQTEAQPATRMMRKRFSECCYSVANLTLIVAAVIALFVLVKFIQDDPLYEYGEYILSLAFYRQLIYALVMIPLVLLVPLYNALNACCLWRTNKHDNRSKSLSSSSSSSNDMNRQANQQSVLFVKLVCECILVLLLFIALVFIGPNVRETSLVSQIELEMRKHMRHRYGNSFSYEFLDSIQQEYECCDELWYRSNLADSLPVSCFVPGSNFSLTFSETCSDAIGSLVATRCAIIAACLIIMLISLAILIAVDIFHWLTLKVLVSGQKLASNGQRYEFVPSDARYANTMAAKFRHSGQVDDGQEDADERSQTRNRTGSMSRVGDEGELLRPSEIVSRLKLNERERQELISSSPVEFSRAAFDGASDTSSARQTRPKPGDAGAPSSSKDYRPPKGQPLEEHRASPTILARANYAVVRRERSRSPTFITEKQQDHELEQRAEPISLMRLAQAEQSSSGRPIRGVLKKTSSYQRIETDEIDTHSFSTMDDDSNEEEGESLKDYAEKLRQNSSSLLRQQQTRRSLLNVRFADG